MCVFLVFVVNYSLILPSVCSVLWRGFSSRNFWWKQTCMNPLKMKLRPLYLRPSPYRAVNTFHLGYKNQSVYAVCGTSRCLFSDKYETHKYSVGRAYSCWMLNCWCITWPVGFKCLNENNVIISICFGPECRSSMKTEGLKRLVSVITSLLSKYKEKGNGTQDCIWQVVYGLYCHMKLTVCLRISKWYAYDPHRREHSSSYVFPISPLHLNFASTRILHLTTALSYSRDRLFSYPRL